MSRALSHASLSMSIPVVSRPSACAPANKPPDPQKGSNTRPGGNARQLSLTSSGGLANGCVFCDRPTRAMRTKSHPRNFFGAAVLDAHKIISWDGWQRGDIDPESLSHTMQDCLSKPIPRKIDERKDTCRQSQNNQMEKVSAYLTDRKAAARNDCAMPSIISLH